MRDKFGDVIQPSKKTSNLFLCFRSRHFSDGSDFVGIYFNTLLTNNKTQKLPRSDTEGTLIWIQTELVPFSTVETSSINTQHVLLQYLT